MKLRLTPTAVKSYIAAPASVQKAFDKQTRLLTDNLHHPSLHAKKYDEASGIWQARVNRDWRLCERAIQVSILVVNVFVRLREMLASNKDLAHKFEKLEQK